MKVVLTGGGTGGHIYPALAVACALQSLWPDVSLNYVGAQTGPEAALAQEAGIPFHGVTARRLRKVASPDTVRTLWALYRGYREACGILRDLKPDVVLGTGGYVAAAALMAASRQRIPIVIHEQNAIPGRTNLRLGRKASRICVTFEDSASAFRSDRTEVTGLPIRPGIVNSLSRNGAREALEVDPECFLLLVLGGSQGAGALNDVVAQVMPALPESVCVLHQTGRRNHDAVVACTSRLDARRYRPLAYLDEATLARAYRAADLVICRSGASTLSEVAANGLACMMVPLPSAYADHQTANARAVQRRGGGILLRQDLLSPDLLREQILALQGNSVLLANMRRASAGLGRFDAAERVARVVADAARSEGTRETRR